MQFANSSWGKFLYYLMLSEAVFFLATSATAETLALWNFEHITTPPTTSSQYFRLADVGGGILHGYHASSSTAWGSTSGNGSNTSLRSNTWQLGDYIEVSTSTLGKSGIYLEWDQTPHQTVGPPPWTTAWSVLVSLDNSEFEWIGNYNVEPLAWSSSNYTSASSHHLDLSHLSFLDDQPNVTFRFSYGVVGPLPPPLPATLRMLFDNITIGSGLIPGNGNFDTIINLPQDGTIDYFIPNNTQVNVHGARYNPITLAYEQGRIGSGVMAGDGFTPANIEINVLGPDEEFGGTGEVDWALHLNNGSTLNLLGGVTYGFLNVHAGGTLNVESGHARNDTFLNVGSTANMSGGIVGGDIYNSTRNRMFTGPHMGLYADNLSHITMAGGLLWGTPYFAAGSQLELQGDEYLLNGQPLVDLDEIGSSVMLNLEPGDILSGTLTDGTPFVLHGYSTQGEVTVVKSLLPGVGDSNIAINDWDDIMPTALRAGQTLDVNSSSWFGGTGKYLVIGPDATANFHNGTLYDMPVVATSGQVTVDGTATIYLLAANVGSEVKIEGGTVNTLFVGDGSQVDVRSGRVLGYDASIPGGSLTMHGGNFRINGSPLALNQPDDLLAVDLAPGDILTGELTDGRPFMLYGGDKLRDGVLSLKLDNPLPIEAEVIDVTSVSSLPFAREGQTVNLRTGGSLPSGFEAGYGSLVTIRDNDTSFNITAHPGSEVVHQQGTSGQYSSINGLAGSSIRMEEGWIYNLSVGKGATGLIEGGGMDWAYAEGELRVTGGSINTLYNYYGGSTTVEGGSIGTAHLYMAELQIEGGSIETLAVSYQGIATFVGTQFIVDGVDVTSLLSTTTPHVVTTRNMQFEGTLADGSNFSEFLSSDYVEEGWYAYSYGTIQLLLATPETLTGDYNGDGLVNLADYTVWRDTLGASVTEGTGADGNGDGMVNAEDYQLWKSHFGNSSGSVAAIGARVPEPGTLLLATFAAVCFLAGQRQRRAAFSALLDAPRGPH